MRNTHRFDMHVVPFVQLNMINVIHPRVFSID